MSYLVYIATIEDLNHLNSNLFELQGLNKEMTCRLFGNNRKIKGYLITHNGISDELLGRSNQRLSKVSEFKDLMKLIYESYGYLGIYWSFLDGDPLRDTLDPPPSKTRRSFQDIINEFPALRERVRYYCSNI